MKIKLLKSIGIRGVHTALGTIIEVADLLGLELVGNGRAEPAPEKDETEAKPKQPQKK